MPNTNTANFFAPGFDDTIEQAAIERQRKLAEALRTQSQTGAKGQMVGNVFVPPSWTQGLAQILQAYQGGKGVADADEKQRALATAMQTRNQGEIKDLFTALRGTPAEPARTIQPLTPNDDEGNPMPVAQKDAVAAVPGSLDKAIEYASTAKSPLVQGYGAQLASGQIQQEQMKALIAEAMKSGGGEPAPSIPVNSAPAVAGGPGPGAVPLPTSVATAVPAVAPAAPAESGPLGAMPAPVAPATAAPVKSVPAAPSTIHGVDKLAFAFLSSGNPTLAKVGSAIAEANKPVAAREGDVLVPDGRGGMRSVWSAPKSEPGIQLGRDSGGQVTSAQQIPGYGTAAAQIHGATAGATAAANAEQEMVKIDTPAGPVMMTRAQAVHLAGGGKPLPTAPAQPASANGTPAPIARPVNPTAPQPGDTDQKQIYTAELAAAREKLANPQKYMTPEQLAADPTMAQFKARAQSDLDGIGREMKRIGIPLQDDSSKAFETRTGVLQADMLNTGHTAAKSAADDLLGVAEARKAVAGGAFQGSGANLKLAITKFINANVPGITVDAEKVGNSDYLKSVLGQSLLNHAKQLGSNPSNADAARINDIVGDLSKDPGAMQKILDWRESMARRAIDLHNTSVDQAVSNGFRPQFDLKVKVPGTAPAVTGFKIIGVQ